MKVICNASPLINLAWIGKLDLLPQIFNKIYIPEAVWFEVVEKGKGQPGAEDIQNVKWLQRHTVQDLHLVHSLRRDLDAGEAEAIGLTIEIQADLLLMDEKFGRETAAYFEIKTLGVLGILTKAKQLGMIEDIKPMLDLLRTQAGFYIHPLLYRVVLQQNSE